MMNESNYRRDNSIDLNLTESETCSLSVVLQATLAVHGIRMIHGDLVEGVEPVPTSHLGVCVDLLRRIDAARHGRKTWNNR